VRRVKTIDMEPVYIARVLEEARGDGRLEGETARAEEYCPAAEAGAHDFIISTNVLEHVEDHVRALRNFRALLAPGGTALILVPAHPSLYSDLDRNLSHFRRYSRATLAGACAEAGLDVLRMRHFNPLGALGWWLNGKVLRRGILPSGQLSLYTRFAIPISRLLDRWNPFPVGVSLVAALVKTPR
jgi:SAM-dependent methyltransferase